METLKGKEVILGVTGGIAAYKAVELLRELNRKGATVQVVMTKNARKFVSSLTFQTLSNLPVITSLFHLINSEEIGHISLAQKANLIIIAPATANIIGKIAAGIADDFLTTMLMATRSPILLAPSMNPDMYRNPIVQKNLDSLKTVGYRIVEPEIGEMACGVEGIGRFPKVAKIIEEAIALLNHQDLKGERILISAGPTQEPIDPIRYISNRSSGKMGISLARVAKRRGADVTLIAGPITEPLPDDISTIKVKEAEEMRMAILQRFEEASIVIMAAAVGDYRALNVSDKKIKNKVNIILEMERNVDILKELGKIKDKRFLVGFSAETDNLLENAQKKLMDKDLDLIVANDVLQEGSGFDWDTNIVTIIDRQGNIKSLPLLPKEEIAYHIFDEILRIKKQ